jgi:hypothetical protein
MKTSLRLFTLVSMIGLLFSFGCQQDVTEIIDAPTAEVITPESNVAELIQRTAMRDGSDDNIIDKSSCSSIVLPIIVVANGLEIHLDSEEDLVTVEKILDQFEWDDDIIEILFPITVILADHTELVINNEDDLEALWESCGENEIDDDIECIDFVYPFTISVFDSENQLSDVITVENDEELHHFFKEFDDDEVASINFPITVVLSDGSEYVVNDHDELENLIDAVKDDCDEDDDNDYNDDDVDDSDLRHILVDGLWEITKFMDEEDETAIFDGYIFDFLENGIVEASKNGQGYRGEWMTYGDDGTLELELFFGNEYPLAEIVDDWDIIEFDGNIIKLKDISGGDGSVEYLTFERPTDNVGGEDNASLSDIIIEGTWMVAKYNDSGDDETTNFDGISFDFLENGTVVATKNDDVLEGTWEVNTDSGYEKFVLDFGDTLPLSEFNDDWDIEEVLENRVEFHSISGGDGTLDVLVFEKESM